MSFLKDIRTYPHIYIFYLTLALLFASCVTGKRASLPAGGTTAMQQEVIDYSMKYLKKPYRYSGKGPNAFDCSGFTSFVFRKFGYSLSPSSAGQDRQVSTIRRKEDLQAGDLVFFEGRSRNGRVGHVGIVTETNRNGTFKFIHAATSSGVIISSSTEPYYRSRYLRGGKVLDSERVYAGAGKTSSENREIAQTTQPKKDKRSNAFVGAKAKNTPAAQPVTIAEVTPQKSSEPLPITVQNMHTPDLTETSRTTAKVDTSFVQPKPLEVQLPDSASKKGNDEKIEEPSQQAIVRQDSVSVPKPIVKEIEPDSTTNSPAPSETHIVKPGETFYSISRKYDCTVAQLRAWNPQVNNVLKSGETLFIHKK